MITRLLKDRDGNTMILLSQCQHINGEIIEIPVDQDLGLPEPSVQNAVLVNKNVSHREPLICFIENDYDDEPS